MNKFFIYFVLFFLLTVSVAYSQTGSIKGMVKDINDQNPIDGVNVVLRKSSDPEEIFIASTTGSAGNFNFQSVPYGDYILTATHIGYETFQKDLVLNQEVASLEILLKEQLVDLGEIIVTSLHQESRIKQVAMPVEVMNSNEVEEMAGFSPSEILQTEPGLTMKDDGIWSTSINIRGLNEQRIVALIDGNRIETATDLAAGLSMVDMSELERIEIIKGASSSLYGTGAMGGVVNFITKKGHFSAQPYTKGMLQSEFQSVNEMYGQKFAVEGGNDFGHFRIGGKIRNAGDVKTPEGILTNSQFEDNNLSLDIGVKPIENHRFSLQLQRFVAKDVGIPGGEPFPEPATATYPEEKRNLVSAKYTIDNLLPSLNQLSVKYYNQYILRDVLLEPNVVKTAGNMRVTPVKTTPTGKHRTNGIELKTNWELGEKHYLIGGLDLWERRLETSREKHIMQEELDSLGNPIDTTNLVRGETPIPKSGFGSAGIFLQDEFYLFNDKLKVTIGGRYDFIRVHNEKAVDPEYLVNNGNRIETPPNQIVTFPEQTVHNKSWSSNLGILYSLTDEIDFTFTAGRSFRSPSIEERYKYIDLGNLVRLGDPELKPEDGYSFDAGFRVWDSKFNLQANGFLNLFSNLVVEQPGEFVKDYEVGTPDTLDALINENVDEARLYGFDVKLTYNPFTNWIIHGNAAYVRGEDTKNDKNLPLIPPLNGRVGVKYHFRDLGSVDLTTVIFDKQDKVVKPAEDVTEGYTLLNISLESEEINFNYGSCKIYGGVENLFDEAYRNHLSSNRGSLDLQPGRNFYIKMQLKF